MEYLKLLIVDMSWQFAALMAIIVICWAISSRLGAEQKRKREQQRQSHDETMADKRQKILEHQPPINRPAVHRGE
jgi:hypothetical protein